MPQMLQWVQKDPWEGTTVIYEPMYEVPLPTYPQIIPPQTFPQVNIPHITTTTVTKTTSLFTSPISTPPTSESVNTETSNLPGDDHPNTGMSFNQSEYNSSCQQPFHENILDEAILEATSGRYYMRELGLWDMAFDNVPIYHDLSHTTFTFNRLGQQYEFVYPKNYSDRYVLVLRK